MKRILFEGDQFQANGLPNGHTGVMVLKLDASGNALLAAGTTVPSALAGYAKGCMFIDTDKSGSNVYFNTGTAASCTFTLVGTIGALSVTGALLATGVGYFQIAVNTNSTTPVNVFGVGGAPCNLIVTSVVSIAKDTTASNIILKQAANTVVTIAKGATAGALVGGVTLSNATYTAADVCTVESSGAGESRVLITFTVA